ncbi:hypothetical protein ABPG74_006399 [Tetrahymena malaccensis]
MIYGQLQEYIYILELKCEIQLITPLTFFIFLVKINIKISLNALLHTIIKIQQKLTKQLTNQLNLINQISNPPLTDYNIYNYHILILNINELINQGIKKLPRLINQIIAGELHQAHSLTQIRQQTIKQTPSYYKNQFSKYFLFNKINNNYINIIYNTCLSYFLYFLNPKILSKYFYQLIMHSKFKDRKQVGESTISQAAIYYNFYSKLLLHNQSSDFNNAKNNFLNLLRHQSIHFCLSK